MKSDFDFELYWLDKLRNNLNKIAGNSITNQIMAGSEELNKASSSGKIIRWTQLAMLRMEELISDRQCREVMTSCACHYSQEELLNLKNLYRETRNLDLIIRKLQELFEHFLRDKLNLEEKYIQQVIDNGWGVAGVRNGKRIIATKIPQSGFLIDYLQETDPEKKKQYYCHCPRIRKIIGTGEKISPGYCYCGAGFYRNIWEVILGQPVEVELLKSILKGDEVCQFAIHLPVEVSS
ncbi:MAG: hypothetical protein JW784_04020 [Candidatus Cloacimonetes bacterium]|nr:hypothetical protein [Candidatus Cloacimonadota bacterium]